MLKSNNQGETDENRRGSIAMSIAPVVKSVSVKAAPKRAFELFTCEMGRWWPARMQISSFSAPRS
jgi:hypothetical protein